MANLHVNPKTMAKYYNQIARGFQAHLPGGWTNFALCAMFLPDGDDEFLAYISCDGGKTWTDFIEVTMNSEDYLEGVYDAQDAVREMHEYCQSVRDDWTQMSFVFDHQADFRCDFSYDVFPRVTPELRSRWKSSTLHP